MCYETSLLPHSRTERSFNIILDIFIKPKGYILKSILNSSTKFSRLLLMTESVDKIIHKYNPNYDNYGTDLYANISI